MSFVRGHPPLCASRIACAYADPFPASSLTITDLVLAEPKPDEYVAATLSDEVEARLLGFRAASCVKHHVEAVAAGGCYAIFRGSASVGNVLTPAIKATKRTPTKRCLPQCPRVVRVPLWATIHRHPLSRWTKGPSVHQNTPCSNARPFSTQLCNDASLELPVRAQRSLEEAWHYPVGRGRLRLHYWSGSRTSPTSS